jgi:hypothetical protein
MNIDMSLYSCLYIINCTLCASKAQQTTTQRTPVNFKNSRLKIAYYDEPDMAPNPLQCVAYHIYGRQIVFTGLHNGDDGPRGSTINYAEEVVRAIATQEAIDGRRYTFYDLQTCRGYGGRGGEYYRGSYCLNELELSWPQDGNTPNRDVRWIEGHANEEVLSDFAEFIWDDLPVGTPINIAVQRGGLKPLLPQQKLLSTRA